MTRPGAWVVAGFAALCLVRGAGATAQSELDLARQEGRTAFAVVTQSAAPGTDRALEIARGAVALVQGSRVVLVDRALPENSGVVKRLRVLAAPVPLILVVAGNGVVAGGVRLQDATPEALRDLVPTPKKAEMLLGLGLQQPVFVVMARRTMSERSAVFEALTQATRLLDHKVTTVVVDLDDEAEAAFVAEMRVKADETSPATVVFNGKAQKTASLRGSVTPAQLVEAAKKKAPCCAGGNC